MAEEIITNILGFSIGGISLVTVFGIFIAYLKEYRKAKKEREVTKEAIVEGFKEVVIPKDIRINLSNKIKPVIQEEIQTGLKPIVEAYNKLQSQNLIMLKIMSKFTHVEDLTNEEQKLLRELIEDSSISEIDLK